ncbi:MAG: hypothetical protein AAB583_00960 [Patescibacteria group bacterium]
MHKEQQSILEFPELNSGIPKKVTYAEGPGSKGRKRRVITLSPGDPKVGEEFINTDLLHFGNKSTVKCVSGKGYVIIRQFQRDGKGNMVPRGIIGLTIHYLEKNDEMVISPDNYYQFGNIGSETLILEDDSPEKNPQLTGDNNLFNWPSALDLFTVRNIGFRQTFTKNGDNFPTIAANPSYGKNAAEGKLFSKN